MCFWFLVLTKGFIYKGAPPQKKPLELSSGGRAPCRTGSLPYVHVLGTHLYQCVSWRCCERRRLATVHFFWRLLQWWVIDECTCPHGAECSAVFDQEQHDPHAPPSLFTYLAPRLVCLFPSMKKVLKRKHFADVEEAETKNGRSIKRHQNRWIQKLVWAVEKMSHLV